jgi:citrate synthase
MTKWLTRAEALRELKVRPQTLYAYASRGQIGVNRDPSDPRRSLYRGEDVAALVARRRRGRRPDAIAASTIWLGEPIIATTISTIHAGRLYYRGHDAVTVSETATLEETAAILWDAPTAPRFDSGREYPVARGGIGRARAYAALAAAAAIDTPIFGRAASVLRNEAATLVGCLASAFGAMPGTAPVHIRLAKGWKLKKPAVDLIRRALVLLADQELTTSAFAARVAASTGASLAACVLAGIATLSGPRHGGAPGRVKGMLREFEGANVEEAVRRHLAAGWSMPGFGHYLYPEGDPRAAALLAAFEVRPRLKQVIATVCATTGQAPTIDVALTALADRFDLPDDAPFALFSIGRSVGWLAQSIEQSAIGTMIRPRARYVGPPLA